MKACKKSKQNTHITTLLPDFTDTDARAAKKVVKKSKSFRKFARVETFAKLKRAQSEKNVHKSEKNIFQRIKKTLSGSNKSRTSISNTNTLAIF